MDNKIILIKFPDNSFHTANVNRFVSVSLNGKEIDTIWYVDLTEIKNESEEVVGSFSIIRDNKDGTYTNLDCGTPENYEKVYEELKKEISNKNYINKSLNDLPYSVDYVEEYDFFKDMTNPEDHPSIIISENVLAIKREMSTRIGAFVDPYFNNTYDLMEEDLCLRLTLIEQKLSPEEWEETKNDILSYITLKKLDMKQGYILINDASDALNEIEQIALNNLKGAENAPIVIKDDDEITNVEEEQIAPFGIESKKEIDTPEEVSKSEENEEESASPEDEEPEQEDVITPVEIEDEEEPDNIIHYPYAKTIFVLWNELLSTLANFAYFEYNSYTEIPSCFNISYVNITKEYRHINKEIMKVIKDARISIDKQNVININDELTKYKFYIIPVDDYDLFVALKESHNPYILSKYFEDSLTPLVDGIKRKNIIITEKETIGIIK